MHPLGLDREWWLPLERFIAPERRLFSLLLIVSLAIHGAGMALVGIGGVPGSAVTFGGPSVTLLPVGEATGAGPESLRLSLKLEDPSAVALPRLVSLFALAQPPGPAAAPMEPAQPEGLMGVRQASPAGIGGIEEMEARMPLGRPRISRVPESEPVARQMVGRILVGAGLAPRYLGAPAALDPMPGDQPLDGPTVVSIGVDPDGLVREAVVVVSSGSSGHDGQALRLASGLRFAAGEGREIAWGSATFYWPMVPPSPREGR
ncbi:MAG: hypothetical protein IT577_21940 [Verrucomicrobiae bacterium]|nr:hypothetical protein [Verrucomicrobiae bacterium]